MRPSASQKARECRTKICVDHVGIPNVGRAAGFVRGDYLSRARVRVSLPSHNSATRLVPVREANRLCVTDDDVCVAGTEVDPEFNVVAAN